MDLSASPSISQSIHLFSNICHFSCHLKHPSIRPSIFQATHSAHPSFIHLSIASIVHWDPVVTAAVILACPCRNTLTDLKQRTGECLYAFSQIIHTCVPRSAPKHKKGAVFPVVFSVCRCQVRLCH
ncbi:hypothetical protein ATANTOWER_023626 [Ataeniobius toweri]|uniref:Uncharacterized protein n=1 Tax=Ataeniobius toweri TaxID=208326 RepID=A0ABU7C577_9TELE|nr:hypothetical protein [Ataeniobius toweri]